MCIDWQMLPEFEGGGFVKLILIYKTWYSVYYFESLRGILTCLLMMSGSIIQTHYAIFLDHSSSRPLQRPDSLAITHSLFIYSKKIISLSINRVTKQLVIWNSFHFHLGPGVTWWLRCCATSRTIPWSNPGFDTEFFIDILPSDRSKSLGSTQPLVKMSARNILGVKAAGVWDWIFHHLHAPNIMKMLESKPPGTVWATPGL